LNAGVNFREVIEEKQNSRLIRFGSFEADLHTRELRKHGLKLKLQEQPFQVLAMLLERPGELVTREEIRAILWPQGTFIDFDHSLNASVRRLREALDDNADTPRFVETLPRRGYRFVAPVEGISREGGVRSEEGSVSKAGVLVGEATQSDAGPSDDAALPSVAGRGALSKTSALVVVVIFALAIAAWIFSMNSRQAVNSIAVLPFTNATGDADLLYLSDGIAESVINNLSQVPGLKVMSRNSAFRYRQPSLKPNRVANELGVGALLMGAMQQHGDEVRVSVELVDGKDEHQIWGEEYTRRLSDLSGIQADIAQQVSQSLRIAGAAQTRIARHDTENSEAYRLYLRGMFALETRKNSDAQTALRYFEQAAHLDRNYALAYSGMANSYALLAFYGGMAPHQAYPLQAAALHQALTLDPDLPDAHAQRGRFLEFPKMQPQAAEAEFRRAIQLSPNSENAHLSYSFFLMDQGRFAEAIAEAKQVLQLDPLWVGSHGSLANIYHYAGRDEEALTTAAKALQPAPPMWIVGVAYEAKKDFPRAIAHLQEVAQAYQVSFAEADVAHAYAASGNTEQAKLILHRLLNVSTKSYVSPYKIAAIYAGLGDQEQMFRWLRAACDEGDPWLARLNIDPDFSLYRSRPEMKEIQQLLLEGAKRFPD